MKQELDLFTGILFPFFVLFDCCDCNWYAKSWLDFFEEIHLHEGIWASVIFEKKENVLNKKVFFQLFAQTNR